MSRTYCNPIYEKYFADPFVWRDGDQYYAIGTGEQEASGATHVDTTPTVFPLLHSTDLLHWRAVGRALVRPDREFGDSFWAPEVVWSEGRWFLYYSVGHGDRLHHLRVAVSSEPLGPYIDVAALTRLDDCAFAIDPHPFRDNDGCWYLFHARDFLDAMDESGRAVRCGTALVVYRLTTMTQLSVEGSTVARARHDWQRFASERPMYGRVFDWHTLEGPFVVHHDRRYYCLYSGGCWSTPGYGVDFVSADSVMGPYVDEGVETGARVLRTAPGKVLGPGHCSVVDDVDGTLHVVYHAWSTDMSARRMCIDRLWFADDGPRSNGPTWTVQSL